MTVIVLLALVALILYVDTRGERKTVRAALDALDARATLIRTDHTALARRVTALEIPGRARAPAPLPPPAPEPSPARAALPAEAAPLPVRVVSVTRDDDPAHTRPTVEAPPPSTLPASARPAPHAPPVKVGAPASGVAPATVPRQSTQRKVRPEDAEARRKRILNEAVVAEAQRARGEDTGERRTIKPAPPNVARALGARETMLGLGVEAEEPSDDRPTDESLTRVWTADETTPTAVSAAPASSRHPMAEEDVDLSPEVLARVDALAREQGLSRDDMLRRLAGQGTTAEEKRKADLDKGKGKP